MAAFPPWYEQYPDRLVREQRAYQEGGFAFDLDEALLAQRQIVVFRGQVSVGNVPYPLAVAYPPGFPFVRPEVISSGTNLARHQNPYARQLCLLENTDVGWDPAMTGGDMVAQAVCLLNDSLVAGPAAVHAREVDAPEPRSSYYPYPANTAVLVPEAMQQLPTGSWGSAGSPLWGRPSHFGASCRSLS